MGAQFDAYWSPLVGIPSERTRWRSRILRMGPQSILKVHPDRSRHCFIGLVTKEVNVSNIIARRGTQASCFFILACRRYGLFDTRTTGGGGALRRYGPHYYASVPKHEYASVADTIILRIKHNIAQRLALS